MRWRTSTTEAGFRSCPSRGVSGWTAAKRTRTRNDSGTNFTIAGACGFENFVKLEPHGTDTDTDTDIRDARIV